MDSPEALLLGQRGELGKAHRHSGALDAGHDEEEVSMNHAEERGACRRRRVGAWSRGGSARWRVGVGACGWLRVSALA
eukprot:3120985-Heterocapsa_arctica.AAC.1